MVYREVEKSQPEKCSETTNKLIQAVYENNGEELFKLLSEESRSSLESRKILLDGSGSSSLATAIREAWNCPRERVLVLAADFDHPHLKGRVRVPIILDPQKSIPDGYVLPEGAPVPSSCRAIAILLTREGEEWKVDNINELAP